MSTEQPEKNRRRQLLATAIFITTTGLLVALTAANSLGGVSDANLVRFVLITVTLATMVLTVAADTFSPSSRRAQDRTA